MLQWTFLYIFPHAYLYSSTYTSLKHISKAESQSSGWALSHFQMLSTAKFLSKVVEILCACSWNAKIFLFLQILAIILHYSSFKILPIRWVWYFILLQFHKYKLSSITPNIQKSVQSIVHDLMNFHNSKQLITSTQNIDNFSNPLITHIYFSSHCLFPRVTDILITSILD